MSRTKYGAKVHPKPTVKLRRLANKSATQILQNSEGGKYESDRGSIGDSQQVMSSSEVLLGQQRQDL